LNEAFSFRIGTGLVHHFNPFRLKENTKNLMLGSRFAFVMHSQLNYSFRGKSWNGMQLGLGLTHFSNGAFAQPNSGINVFFLSAGYYLFRKEADKATPILFNENENRFEKGFSGLFATSFAIVERSPADKIKYGVFQVYGKGSYRVGRYSSINIGLEGKHNGAVKSSINENPELGRSALTMGLPIGHELHISRISLITEFGFYLYKKHTLHPATYQRYGLRHYWKGGFHTGVYLQTHRAKAECIEWAIGYKFVKL
jgi:hypothetical protein